MPPLPLARHLFTLFNKTNVLTNFDPEKILSRLNSDSTPTLLRLNSDSEKFVHLQEREKHACGACPMQATKSLLYMSKGNMLLGHARGKVGSLVFSRSNGKQVVRAKADTIKNPQTQAQTIQRIFLNTVAQAYSRMSAIVDHSFEGIPAGQQSMSYFMKKNLKGIRERVAALVAEGYSLEEIFDFSPLNTDIFVTNEYVVAKGQLPEVKPVDCSIGAAMAMPLSANTYQAVIDAYGLQRGDQLTFMTLNETSSDFSEFGFARVILDPRTPFIVANAINLPNEKNEGSFSELAFSENGVEFGFSNYNVNAAAIIVSRKGADGTWLRSNASFVYNESSGGSIYSLQACLDAFASGDLSVLSQRYLNNAGKGKLAKAGEPAASAYAEALTFNGTAVTPGETATIGDGGAGRLTAVTIANRDDEKTYTVRRFKNGTQQGSDMVVQSDGSLSPADSVAFAEGDSVTYKLYEGTKNLGTILNVTVTAVTNMAITAVSADGTNFTPVPASDSQVVKVQFTGDWSAENKLRRYVGSTLRDTTDIAQDGTVAMDSILVDEDPIYIKHYRGDVEVATVSQANV